MKLVVGQWLIHSSENLIVHVETEKVVKLEPRAMEALTYFCEKPNQVISRDELIEQVWQGRIVGDHAIYRVINQIRKSLDPNEKDSYIRTIAKKGYKLTQTVTVQNDNPTIVETDLSIEKNNLEVSRSEHSEVPILELEKTVKFRKYFIFLGLIVLALFLIWKLVLEKQWSFFNEAQYTEYFPLTVANGIKDYPKYSSDGNFIVFSLRENNELNDQIYAQSITSKKLIQLTNNEKKNIKPVSSNNLQVIVFQEVSESECKIVSLKKLGQDDYDKDILFDCVGNEDIDFDISHDGSILYHTYKDDVYTISRIFSYEIATGKRELISTTIGNDNFGDSRLSLSPSGKKIAFLRNLFDGKTILFLYDLELNEEIKLKEIDRYLDSIGWANNDEFLIYPVTLSTLNKYSIEFGYNVPIMSSMNAKIERFDHSPNSSNLLIVDISFEYEIMEFDLKNCPEQECDLGGKVSSFVEQGLSYYPIYANTSNDMAFISRKSGQQEIWHKDTTGSVKKLTTLPKKEVISHFSWSPNDKYVALNTLDEVYVFEVGSETINRMELNESLRSASWVTWALDESSLYFSSDNEGKFDVFKYNLHTQKITQEKMPGVALFFEISADESFFLYWHKPGLWKNVDDPIEIYSEVDFENFRNLVIRKNQIFNVPNFEGQVINRVDFDGNKKMSYIVDHPSGLTQFSVNKDSTKLVTSAYKFISKEIIVVSD